MPRKQSVDLSPNLTQAQTPKIDQDYVNYLEDRSSTLETLLRNLLTEVGHRDALLRISDQFCVGCWRKKVKDRACVAAREYLDA